ncbi:MAG: penicillin acylase family protein [Myxococcota bacterium]
MRLGWVLVVLLACGDDDGSAVDAGRDSAVDVDGGAQDGGTDAALDAPRIDAGDAAIEEGIEVLRDEFGTPHIYADTMNDGMYALGWATAEDRLFQMEFARRFAAGRMAETFGQRGERELNDRLIDHDRYARTFGIERRAAESVSQLPGDIPELLAAYAEGVNEYVRANGLPDVYETLGLTWEPWRPVDSLMAWERVALHHQKPDMQREIAALLDCRGGCTPAPCGGAGLPADPGATSTPPPADGVWPPGDSRRAASFPRGSDWMETQKFYASHGWAVHGSRIDSGVSMLFGEPKLDVVAPPHWYQYHLVVRDEDVDVRGAGFAGAPGMVMFWTRYTAQTITAGTGDIGDLFELTPGRAADTYVVDGEEVPYQMIDETIAVRGGDDVTVRVRESRYGPVINDLVTGEPESRDYALRWVEHLELDTHSIVAGIQLQRTDSLASYQEAITHWVTPKANAMYAGRDRGDTTSAGHIAFYSLLSIPVRAPLVIGGVDMTGQHPYDGSDSSNDWDGVYDLAWHPHVVDPPEGYIVNGNSAPAGNWIHDHLYTGLNTIGDTWRSMQVRRRIQELLPEDDSRASGEAFDDIRVDGGMWGVELLAEMLSILESRGFIAPPPAGENPDSPEERAALVRDALDLWIADGGQYDARSALSVFALSLTGRMVLASRSATALHCTYAHGNSAPPFILRSFSEDPTVLDLDVAAWAVASADAAWLNAAPSSPDPREWVDPDNADFVVEVQNNWYCELPVDPMNRGIGCSLTPEFEFVAQLPRGHVNTINSAPSSSFPFTVDFADIDESRALLPPGTNENPDHPHFDSAREPWEALARGENALPRAPLSRDAIEEGSRVVLMR